MHVIQRGAKRTDKPDLFLSHSSRDKTAATQLALTLNSCGIDVWLDDWELSVGQSLTDEISRAMSESRFIAILITENYNRSVWTKTEYKKALARERAEQRTVMLPIIVGAAEIPDFLEDKIYVDLRIDYYAGIIRLVGMIHDISSFRVSRALNMGTPSTISEAWELLESIGFEPYIVLGKDDFDEVLKCGAYTINEGYARFNHHVLSSKHLSSHVRTLIEPLLSGR